MKIILLLLLVSLASFAKAQNKVDEKGRKQGAWQKTHPKSTALQYKGQFLDDKPVGTFTYYYTNKGVQAIIKHDPNSNRSSATFYHNSGVVMSKGIYRDMKKDSTWLNYAPSGRLSSSETYKADILNGKKIIYYLNEDLSNKTLIMASVCTYLNGKMEDERIEYFDNGSVKSKGNYKDNKKVGVWETNHPNGNVMNIERYKNGVLHGWCIVKDESGKEIGRSYFYYGERLEGKKLDEKMAQFKQLGINPNN